MIETLDYERKNINNFFWIHERGDTYQSPASILISRARRKEILVPTTAPHIIEASTTVYTDPLIPTVPEIKPYGNGIQHLFSRRVIKYQLTTVISQIRDHSVPHTHTGPGVY